MRICSLLVALFLLPAVASAAEEIREWSDVTGRYTAEGQLIAASETTAVLKMEDEQLVAVAIEQLSEADRQYIAKWHEAQESADPQAPHLWTMQGGLQVKGWVVAYGRRDVTLQRHRGKLYVNDKQFDNLPDVYQKMVPRIIGHFENKEIETKEQLTEWARRLKAAPYTVSVDGVMLELEGGDRYLVPFFFFSDKDRRLLEPGWQRWLAEQEQAEARERENFLLRAQTEAYHQNQQQQLQMQQLHLQLLAVDAGLVDLWKVALIPKPGTHLMPGVVVVPARNSRDAAQAALAAHPGYTVGPIARVNR